MPEDFYSISKPLLPLLICILLGADSLAQPKTIPVPFPLHHENFSLTGFSFYALTSKDEEYVPKILLGPFYPLRGNGKTLPVASPYGVKRAWIWFATRNQLMADTFVIMKVEPYSERMILYEQLDSSFVERGRSGKTIPITQQSIAEDDKRIRVPLKAGQI